MTEKFLTDEEMAAALARAAKGKQYYPSDRSIHDVEALATALLATREAARRVIVTHPTTIEPFEGECRSCGGSGIVNIGTPIDPEPGPCLACGCSIHQEHHTDCLKRLRAVLEGGE